MPPLSLNDQLNSFKQKVRHAPVLGKRTVEPSDKGSDANSGDSWEPLSKRSRGAVHSQPASTWMGQHRNTQVVHAVEYLKKLETPVLFRDLESYLSGPIQPLIPLLQNNPNLRVDLRNQTVTYVSKLGIYSGEELLRYLRNQKTFSGLSVKDLKDGWSGAVPTVLRLENDHKLLVLRNKKDNSPRFVWANTEQGLGSIDPRFVSLWQSAKVPTASDLPKMLEKVGLKPSSIDPSEMKQKPKQEPEKKQRRAPRSKITNVHMRGLLKDFS